MNLLHWNTLLYLSFHLVGFLFCLISMFGIPGQLDDTNPSVKKVLKVFNLFLNLSYKGIPFLIAGTILAFFLEWKILGITLSIISLSLGLTTFVCLVSLYKIK